jgi:hypothetical protein
MHVINSMLLGCLLLLVVHYNTEGIDTRLNALMTSLPALCRHNTEGIDTRLKDLWHNETHLQFNWQPEGAGDNKGIFSHVLDTHYGAPEITYGARFSPWILLC